MENLIERVYGPLLLIVGLSHFAHPGAWAEAFAAIRRTGSAALWIGLGTLAVGLVLVAGHNRWAWGWPLVVTLAGWGSLVKGTVYLLAPGVAERGFALAGRRSFRAVGLPVAALGTAVTWHAFGGTGVTP